MKLATIDLNQNIELTKVAVGTKQLTSLDIGNLPKVMDLCVSSHKLTDVFNVEAITDRPG